mgnify:CR=1 FL=1
MMPQIQADLGNVTVDVANDNSVFIDRSIKSVFQTIVEAVILVALVIFVFLRNVWATIIPALAIPLSIIGTFAGMYLLGFSINLLTLFGLVLAIGIVVDDAIVVLENVERIMSTEHKGPREAAIQAMEEVTGPVIAIVLVLCAVFIPVSFLGGLAGELYRQFAVTIAVSVIISGVVALTLTPALAASALGAWEKIDSVLGLGRESQGEAPAELVALLAERQAARKASASGWRTVGSETASGPPTPWKSSAPRA